MDRKAVVGGLVALGISFVGCGSAGPMTKAAFVREAQTICAQRRAAFVAAQRVPGEVRQRLRHALSPFKQSVDKLGALRPPAEMKTAFADVLAVERHQVKVGEIAVKTGRFPADATEHGPILHRHEAERQTLGMANCD